MSYLTREQILNADDLKTQEVKVPEWGGIVVVRSMTGTERDAFEASIVDNTHGNTPKMKLDNFRAKLVVKTVIDPETKKAMFTVADIEVLGNKSVAALDRVYDVAQKLSKISAEDVDDLIKN